MLQLLIFMKQDKIMKYNNSEVLELIALTPKGEERAKLLQNEKFRNCVLSSGANVTIYTGDIDHSSNSVTQSLKNVYVGLIQRKNKHGRFDGLGALGGLAERTNIDTFNILSVDEKLELVSVKDDVVLIDNTPVIINDIDKIRKNNVLREMKEELANLGIYDKQINPNDLELIPMPQVKDDNYMINIWDGTGECYAITPYCHIYHDKLGLIDAVVQNGIEQAGGEVSEYKKIPIIDALGAYGKIGDTDCLEDGRDATKDYRYPHEYLASWALASKLLNDDNKMVELSKAVQHNTDHLVSFESLAKAMSLKIEDIANIINVKPETIAKMDRCMKNIHNAKSNPSICIKNEFTGR